MLLLLATDLTELALDPKPKLKLCSLSLCEGVMLRFIVFRLSTLARKDTESASASTLLSVAPAAPVRLGGVIVVVPVVVLACGGVVWDGKAFAVVAGEVGDIRSSTGTSISDGTVVSISHN